MSKVIAEFCAEEPIMLENNEIETIPEMQSFSLKIQPDYHNDYKFWIESAKSPEFALKYFELLAKAKKLQMPDGSPVLVPLISIPTPPLNWKGLPSCKPGQP